jgi:hypothetical protein
LGSSLARRLEEKLAMTRGVEVLLEKTRLLRYLETVMG